MGLFGGTRIDVASSVYNLAGDEREIPNYLKTVVANHMLGVSSSSMARAISSSYLNGPGLKLPTFYRWAQRRYGVYSYSGVLARSTALISPEALAQHLPIPGIQPRDIQSAETGFGDFRWWAKRWLLEHHPERFNEDWTAVMMAGPVGSIRVTFPDNSMIRVPKNGYNREFLYLYVAYQDPVSREPRIYIYQYSTGIAAIDSLLDFATTLSDYYPVMPVRLENEFVSPDRYLDYYRYTKRSLKKIGNIDLDELIEKLSENENLDDIDYAFVVPGIPLNTTKKAGLEYIYKFLSFLPSVSMPEYQEWIIKNDQGEEIELVWEEWQVNPDAAPEPEKQGRDVQPGNSLYLPAPRLNYAMAMDWGAIEETTGSGLARPNARAGDLWWVKGDSKSWQFNVVGSTVAGNKITERTSEVELYWQVTANSWKKLTIRDLVHKNIVYKGNYVQITAAEAIDDPELSGFVIPLKNDILQELSLKEMTELSSIALVLVLNAVTITKLKWYQTGFFKLVLIVAVVLTVALTGGFSATGVGVLGSNLAVGSAIGLAGTAAVIAGVIANAVAAAIITSIITKGATAVFGDAIGQIVAVVASFIALNAVGNFATTGSFSINWSQLTRVDNLINMTSATGSAIARAVQIETMGIVEDTTKMLEEYQSEMERISKAFSENLGYDNGVIDPMQFLSSNQQLQETPEGFLKRTLMTGSDIADLTLQMVSNFTDISLDLNKMA